MNKRIKIIAVVAVVGLLGWFLARRFFTKPFLYAGTVEATEVDLSSRLTSVIAAREVDEGQAVKAGETLVRLVCDEQQLAADLAKKNYDRGSALFKAGSMPREDFDRIQFQRDDTALKVSWCMIVSPTDGMVLDKYVEPGERVVPGSRLLTVADLREVYAYVYVPQPMLKKLKIDAPVRAYLPEADQWMDGRIGHLRDEAEFTPKNVQTRDERQRLVFGVKIYFPNPERLLKPGMTVEVRFPS